MDPLTKEERDSLMRQLELHLSHLHVNSEDTHHLLKKCGVWNIMRDEIDRLCREVEAMQVVMAHVAEWARGRAHLEDEADEQGGEEHHAIARKIDSALTKLKGGAM